MDSALRALHALDLSRVQAGIRSFVEKTREAAGDRPWLRPLLHSLILLPVALLLGSWASETSQREAVTEYEDTHLPRLESWRALMTSRSFVEAQPATLDAESRRRLRILRADGGPEGRAWISRQARWLAVTDSQGIPLLFERDDRCRRERMEKEQAPASKHARRVRAKRKPLREKPLPELRVVTKAPGESDPWNAIGRGWPAFEEALSRTRAEVLATGPCGAPASGEEKKVAPLPDRDSGNGRDPREVLF